MKRCLVISADGETAPVEDLDEISELLSRTGDAVWLDMLDPRPEDFDLVKTEFNLHPLAIEDALNAHQRAKIESYGDSWFIVAKGATLAEGSITFHEIAIFAGPQFVVTVRNAPAYPIEEIDRRRDAHLRARRADCGVLLYALLDTIVDGYVPLVEELEERVDALEDVLFSSSSRTDEVLVRIFELRKEVHAFGRLVAPMRDVFTPILRGDVQIIPADDLPYFRDVHDHVVRVVDRIASIGDSLDSARETHLSMASHRQNEVTKQLTVVATIFLPLTFITGFFGQNFSWLNERVGSFHAFALWGIGSEACALALLLGYFRYKRWF